MKKLLLIFLGLGLIHSVLAQNWEVPIHRSGEKHHLKTLKLKPGMPLTIGRLVIPGDSIREFNYYEGTFLGGTDHSMQIVLQEVQTNQVNDYGISSRSTIPASFYPDLLPGDSGVLEMALKDIDYLRIKASRSGKTAGAIVESLIYVSIFTLIASPFISYNYKEGELDADRYKYWALGSTMGLTAGFLCVITFNAFDGPKTFQFREGWPAKKSKLWEFDSSR